MKKNKEKQISGTPPQKKKGVILENPRDLPQSYGITQLTFLARHPNGIHAYWEIASTTLDVLNNRLGGITSQSRLVLRVYDVTLVDFNGRNANHYFDINVGGEARDWYIEVWGDNASYCGELGVNAPDGQFHPVVRSNVVTTPRKSFSSRHDVIWMDRREEYHERPYVVTEFKNPADRTKNSIRKKEGSPSGQAKRQRKFYLSEDDIRSYYANLSPLLGKVRRRRKLNAVQEKEKSLLDVLGEDYKRMYGGVERSVLIPFGDSWRKIFLGASAEIMGRGGASEQRFPGASEALAGTEQKGRKFFFEIGTELIVYGRSEPDARIHLGEKEIKLGPDGTFSLRFALPGDHKIPLDFTAESGDKVERREIVTAVERAKTRYSPSGHP